MQDYGKLQVWHRAHVHAISVQRVTRDFPRTGYTSLKSQLVRAAESIPTNIVEGCGAATPKEFGRFLDISIKSSREVEYHLLLARDYGILPYKDWRKLTAETIEIRRMLCGLRKKVIVSLRSLQE